MRPERWRERVRDILDCIASAQRHVEGLTAASFAADRRAVAAVAYELIVIGEAARSLPPELTDRHPEIPWARMRAVRNVVAHEYQRVDPAILWGIVTTNLPHAVGPLHELLEPDES